MKLDSDYKHDTDYFGHKFMSKVEAIFNGLPKPKEWQSLLINDLPLLTTIDPKLAVHRSNNQNRDATPGQKAMAFAMQWPETFKVGRKKKGEMVDSSNQFDKSLLSRARYVLRNSPMVEGERYPRRCLSANVNRRHNRRA